MDSNAWDEIFRLLAAAGAGIAIGLNREMQGKPLGMRTLALVALGSAIAALTAVDYRGLDHNPDALSRVVQGVLQGVLTGIGFIGAGVVLRNKDAGTVEGLTTAASVWVTAAIGIACALAAWHLVIIGVVLTLVVLAGLGWVEDKLFPSRDAVNKPQNIDKA
ncbi:MgtC/SapB family protein [Undibacter mobilis]|uniref:Protein MgtC n=1 Tax=Undibacter mobilis TaxID=2292256 RepID=A0A371BAN5_9BRAD|nr:MgtC/SapB family protein [Undibacter mobilis]RDV04602.1 MgtC/SapB family protein [Undibacter mobilis]